MSDPNPLFGVLLHAIGGLGAASFYFPMTRVRHWAWETFWLVGGIVFWIISPWVAAYFTVPELREVLQPAETVISLLVLGALWGIGNLTFGLSLRYLGMSLGMTMTLGFCTVVGTLVPPLRAGKLGEYLHVVSGQTTLAGVAICVIGIALCGIAGMRKEGELTAAGGRSRAPEFHFSRGAALALFAGVMSACFALAVDTGEPIAEAAYRHGAGQVWRNGPTVALILSGGALTNAAWCLALNFKNRTLGDYVDARRANLLRNYLLCALAGAIAYSEFLFFGMGESQMGSYRFCSWSIHMAFVVVFSNLWGLVLAEWLGTSRVTRGLLLAGLAILVGATGLMSYGAYLKGPSPSDEQHLSQPAVEALGALRLPAQPRLTRTTAAVPAAFSSTPSQGTLARYAHPAPGCYASAQFAA